LQAILQAILPLALWAATPTHLSELAPAGPIELHEALDLYGHLMPGNEDEAAALLDAYLERADTAALGGRPAVG
jgi:hypothetical protein